MTNLPTLAVKLAVACNGWIVGSAAKEGIDLAAVRDIDIVIPYSNWPQAAPIIPPEAIPNSFGGWKIKGPIPIDVWPDDLSRLMASNKTTYFWHPFTGIRWERK